MKASEFLKKYEREQQAKKDESKGEGKDPEEDHSLQAHAKERAAHPNHLNAGTPYDWEDLEAYQRELDRMDREGPGGSSSGKDKASDPRK